MFIPSTYKIDDGYASLKADLNIEDYGELNNYLDIEMDH